MEAKQEKLYLNDEAIIRRGEKDEVFALAILDNFEKFKFIDNWEVILNTLLLNNRKLAVKIISYAKENKLPPKHINPNLLNWRSIRFQDKKYAGLEKISFKPITLKEIEKLLDSNLEINTVPEGAKYLLPSYNSRSKQRPIELKRIPRSKSLENSQLNEECIQITNARSWPLGHIDMQDLERENSNTKKSSMNT